MAADLTEFLCLRDEARNQLEDSYAKRMVRQLSWR